MLIELLETTFKHGDGVEKLVLSSNWITSVHPRAFQPLTSLTHLDLSNNYLEGLNTVSLEPVERSLHTLKLGGNPWNCGCQMKELWSWLQDHLSYVDADTVSLTCDMPKVS